MEQLPIYEKCTCMLCKLLPYEDRPFIGSIHYRLLHAASAEDEIKDIIKETRKGRAKGNTYFCTLTTPPGFKDYKLWLQAIHKVLSRKFVLGFKITAEHINTNLHAHILIKANKQVQKKDFHSYCKATGAVIIDCRKVIEDNGIEDYIQLENPSFDNFSEFQNFILTYNNGVSKDVSQDVS